MKILIFINPSTPISLKFTAQGYMKITSTSKRTNKMATRKYLTEKGIRAFPTDSIPHSKLLSLLAEDLLGPNKLEPKIVKATNPTARSTCIRMGIKSI